MQSLENMSAMADFDVRPPVSLKPELSMTQTMLAFAGLNTPLTRFLFGFTICETGIFILQPSLMFDERGNPKNLGFHPDKTHTIVPWYVPGLALGSFLALFF